VGAGEQLRTGSRRQATGNRNSALFAIRTAATFVFVSVALLGASCTGCAKHYDGCVDPNSQSVSQDGECCQYSINCQPGSICNDRSEDLYDPAKATQLCIRVVCASDAECAAPKRCTLASICEELPCRSDRECEASTLCLAGRCSSPPSPASITACAIATPQQTIGPGEQVELTAVAFDGGGQALGGVSFDWTSDDPSIASVATSTAFGIATSTATGGMRAGVAHLTATVRANPAVTCAGLSISTFLPVPGPVLVTIPGGVRVVVVDEASGAPIEGASVVLVDDGGGRTQIFTDARGVATLDDFSAIASVTVVKDGFDVVSVLSPGTKDLLIPVPLPEVVSRSSGYRGTVDISSTRHADIQLGFAGRPIPASILDLSSTAVLGDRVDVTIDAPELGFNDQRFSTPGGYVGGLGKKSFTADRATPTGDKCANDSDLNHVGCAVVRMPQNPSAAWALAGQLKLSQVTQRASMFPGMILPTPVAGFPLEHFVVLSWFEQSWNHAVSPWLWIGPNVYRALDLAADVRPASLSVVDVPRLPSTSAGGCADSMLLIASASLPGRGLVPLGVSSGVDQLRAERPDCIVGGAQKPFGDNAEALANGTLPLSMAPLHGGLEGSRLVLLLLAYDSKSTPDPALSVIVTRRRVLAEHEHLSDVPFAPYPTGTLARSTARAEPIGSAGSTFTRLEIPGRDRRWLVYAPGDRTSFTLPDEPSARSLLAGATGAHVQTVRASASYADLWRLGSGRTLVRIAEVLTAFAEAPLNFEP
jgi:hypothetical protein